MSLFAPLCSLPESFTLNFVPTLRTEKIKTLFIIEEKQKLGHDISPGSIYSFMNGTIFSLNLSVFICKLEKIATLHVYSGNLIEEMLCQCN